MKITKLGHCCLLIEEGGTRILTDPGSFTDAQDFLNDIDVILITHEHQDHFHIPSVKNILVNNPKATIVTNLAVGRLLDVENISYKLVAHEEHLSVKHVLIEGFGELHAEIHSSLPRVENTGYMINNKLFYPGDVLYNPDRPVEILALPVSGPWLKISEAIDYARTISPKIAFPVHDGSLKSSAFLHSMCAKILESFGVQFLPFPDSETKEF